jgi:hypothetical protein
MRLLALACLMSALLALACIEEQGSSDDDNDTPTQDIVTRIPWPGGERNEYDLTLGDDEGLGVLTANLEGDNWELFLGYESGDATDEATVIALPETLKPLTVRRETGSGSVVRGEYDSVENIVTIFEGEGDDADSRPERLEDNYYDNESSFFLWRTIDFSEGYEASYHAVLVNQGGDQPVVTIRVTGQEEVTVPAGTFNAWRLEVDSSLGDVVAWIADTTERQLLRYENENIDFVLELTSSSSMAP